MLKLSPVIFLSVAQLFCFSIGAYAQNKSDTSAYIYQNIVNYKEFLKKNTDDNSGRLSAKIQKSYRDIVSEKNNEIIKQLAAKGFLFDDTLYPYLHAIFDHILEKNSLNKNQFHFFVDRTYEINAYSFEDGTIVCDLGLLKGMDNESQLAMVFCHEIAHYLLKHSNTAIINQLAKYTSPEFLKKIKAIKKQEYNSKKQLEGLMMTDVFDRRKHGRGQEKAADSLGMLLFSNTGYSARTVPDIFDFLDSASSLQPVCTIQSFFNREKIDLDESSYILPSNKMHFGGTEKKEITDSLKTHPDCAKRKIEMQSFFTLKTKSGTDYLTGDTRKLAEIKKIALFDEAAHSKDNDNLGLYLYQLIQIDSLFISDSYIKTEIFNTMQSLCKHYKAHTLHEVVGNQYASNDNDEYAKLLKLIDSINLDKMVAITKTYYQNNKPLITASGNFTNHPNN